MKRWRRQWRDGGENVPHLFTLWHFRQRSLRERSLLHSNTKVTQNWREPKGAFRPKDAFRLKDDSRPKDDLKTTNTFVLHGCRDYTKLWDIVHKCVNHSAGQSPKRKPKLWRNTLLMLMQHQPCWCWCSFSLRVPICFKLICT